MTPFASHVTDVQLTWRSEISQHMDTMVIFCAIRDHI